jgi:FixJ family two-component response regulator
MSMRGSEGNNSPFDDQSVDGPVYQEQAMPRMGDPKVVLVVEDDDGMREAIENLLGVAGFSTLLYESAESMLAEDACEHPLCVISDLNLPAMSGLDLLTELQRRSRHVPFIIITAYDSESTRQEAARRGAIAYLPKPFPSIALLTAIESIAARAMQQ